MKMSKRNPLNLTDEQIQQLEDKHVKTVEYCGDVISDFEDILKDVERMMKENEETLFRIDWDKVPEEYNYVAADADGRIFAYKYKPELPSVLASWYICQGNDYQINYYQIGFSKSVAKGNIDWRTTLTKRP